MLHTYVTPFVNVTHSAWSTFKYFVHFAAMDTAFRCGKYNVHVPPLPQNRETNVHGEQKRERERESVHAGLWLHTHRGTVQILGTVGRASGGRRLY